MFDPTKALVGGISGGGIGEFAVYTADRFGAHLTSSDGTHIGIAAAVVGAAIIHYGLRGVAGAVWRGLVNGTPPPA